MTKFRLFLLLILTLAVATPTWAQRLASEVAHDAALPASSMMVITGCEAKDFDGAALPRAVSTEGDAVRCAATLSGVPYVMLVSEDGSLTIYQVEDAAHVSGHAGIQMLTVRQDTAAALAGTDGDYQPPITDATGRMWVNTEFPDAAALADAASAAPTTPTSGVIPLLMNATTVDRQRAVVNSLDSTGTGIAAAGMVGQLDDTGTSTVTENQFAVARLSSRRAQLMEGVSGGTPLRASQTAATTNAGNNAMTADTTLVAAVASTRLYGFSVRESAATAAVATVILRHGVEAAGSCTGNEIAYVELGPDQSRSDWYGDRGVAVASGVCADVLAGTIDISTRTNVEAAP